MAWGVEEDYRKQIGELIAELVRLRSRCESAEGLVAKWTEEVESSQLAKAQARRAAERAVNTCEESIRRAAKDPELPEPAQRGLMKCATILRQNRQMIVDDAVDIPKEGNDHMKGARRG